VKAVDLFAGWGGFTLGAEMADVRVLWAANHHPLAVEAHAANHPGTVHVCQDLRQADWTALPSYDLLLASPACQGHSEASQPRRSAVHDAMRATAWAVVDCAEVTRPRAIIVENIPAMQRWILYPVWLSALARLGYTLTERLAWATDHGVPQRRERLIVVGLQGGRAFAPSFRTAMVEPPFGPCIEFDASGWRPVSECRSPKAVARIRRAQSISGRRCLVQHVTGHPGVPLHEAIRTITTKDQWVLVDGDRYRPLTVREYARGQSFPDSYTWPAANRADTIRGIGNAIPPLLARDYVAAVQEAA
jgi:DNA (cytosine-5)-methyltransferase 1